MSVTKKQIEQWIEELEIDWKSHGISKKELIDTAHEEEDPRTFLEELASGEDDPIDEDQEDQDPVEGSEQPSPPTEPVSSDEAPEPQYARQGTAHQPVCPIHKVKMRAGSTQGPITYYYCPDPSCSHSESVPRVNMQQFMQRQGQREAKKPQVDPRI